ncbi:hypothetical protein D3C81_984690 [compost metagenome]
MSGEAHEIHGQVYTGNLQRTERLYSINMKNNPMLTGDFPDLHNRLHGSYFIIRIHYADQYRLICNCFLNLIRIHPSMGIYGQICDLVSILLQTVTSMKHSVMLYCSGDNMSTLLLAGGRHSKEGQIITFRPAGGEHQLIRTAVQRGSENIPCPIDCTFGCPAESMYAGSIPILSLHDAQHFLSHLRMNWGGGCMI